MKIYSFLSKLKKNAVKYKNSIAIEIGNFKLSYGEFWRNVEFLSLSLYKIKKNPKVIIVGDKNILSYISIFSVLRAGGTYIPVSSKIPQDRLIKIVKLVKPEIIIGSKNFTKKISKIFKKIKYLDKIPKLDFFFKKNNNYNLNKIKPNRLAYIIFTSGSSGEPKGVKISRESLSNYINWVVPSLKIYKNKKCTQFPDISFDLSVADIYATLCGGGTLCPTYNKYYEMYPGRFIKEHNITHLVCVPSYIDLMLNADDLKFKNIKSLESIFFCGEPLMKYHVKSIFDVKKNIKLINAYGPTEATCSCTFKNLTPKNFKDSFDASMSIGKSIPGTKIVLKNNNKENNNEGEIFIQSKQVADGYMNKKNNYNKFFFKGNMPEFRTGDYAIKKKGDLYFKKRLDNQIKIKGHRIELDEINFNIEKIGFKKVISIVYKSNIYSFISNNKNLNVNEIKREIIKVLPDYMMPKNYFSISKFPLNKNKKIDRLSLLNLLKKTLKK